MSFLIYVDIDSAVFLISSLWTFRCTTISNFKWRWSCVTLNRFKVAVDHVVRLYFEVDSSSLGCDSGNGWHLGGWSSATNNRQSEFWYDFNIENCFESWVGVQFVVNFIEFLFIVDWISWTIRVWNGTNHIQFRNI